MNATAAQRAHRVVVQGAACCRDEDPAALRSARIRADERRLGSEARAAVAPRLRLPAALLLALALLGAASLRPWGLALA
ncbi:MAG: hypothetical protein KGI36_08155, partial [Burkholderiales bacterium]|nr:hypothetical protein [Burkholderiales bacterium]